MYATVAILVGILFSTCVYGQASESDSLFVQSARNRAISLYEQTLKQQAHVYEGDQYVGHDPRIKIHPFYRTDSLQNGTVLFNGVQYRDVNMQYDIVWDQLIIQPLGGGYRLRLRPDKIAAFSLGAHQFARIVGDSVAGVRTGFYELIYNGRVKALARRAKTVQEDISGGVYKADYLPKDRFLIVKDGAFYEVKSKRSVLNVFPDQAKELRKYLRQNKLKFNEEVREQTIAKLTQRYDELTH
ncbi:hypothetical protein [Spirosoma sp. KNUC1025]|uniref:hypothetical protein n=1 Tax=Spirosoma sp. KNUC1025 TaxID=2894082 RepID=UPI00386C3FA3|nr:hypothetical protein LN737_17265 [Spirosoma sp. KNUC1025]